MGMGEDSLVGDRHGDECCLGEDELVYMIVRATLVSCSIPSRLV